MPAQTPRPGPSRPSAKSPGTDWMDAIFEGGAPSPATRQMIFGGVSGWVTGFLAMKVGKAVAIALGGGIILLQVANHQGYININWSRFQSDVDRLASKINESENKKSWTDKLEKKLEKMADKAEDIVNRAENKSKRWYDKLVGRESRNLQLFITSFAVGTAIGVVTGG